MKIRNNYFHLFTVIIIVLSSIESYGQEFSFNCDPPLSKQQIFLMSHHWADDNINKVYDSLRKIDFTKQDFEIRIWYSIDGICNNVFIMRHYPKKNKWKAFYYTGYDTLGQHKTMTDYFTNNELKENNSKEWNLFWNKLTSYNILNINPPTMESLEKILGGYPDISHDEYYSFELIKKDCRRGYSFSQAISDMKPVQNIQEYKDFKAIVKLMNTQIKNIR
jgi:hypothetical protein